ncbi:RimK family alpha-L-glutamate ligase [Halobacteriovorax sp. HLS]|uniref:RimK family alpha-L-glutamate ligase n=1 Tax=Halobacteriovorax sp. HLS TaxID=2234000 RepID=UPI000FDC1170|nr:RimK family alpha-L-glutamate ligase [Halobacteriovorax sp. HLS]
MKLAILSREKHNYSTKRLVEACKLRGHEVKVLNTLKFAIDLEEGDPDLYYNSKRIGHFDAVLPRIGTSVTYFGTAVVRQFQQMDVYCANSADGILNSRDKLRSFQILSKLHVGLPYTTFVKNKADVIPAIERIGGAPIVIKLLEGTQGIGVLLAHTMESATSIIELLQSQKQNILIQKFVAESKGKDIRAIVIGDQVVAAMRRVAQGQEFRSNVHRGGKTELVELSDEYKETAIRAAKILGLGIAGVDMLEGHDGPQIMEINSSPGLEGIEGCTKKDIAGAMIDYIAAQVDFPEIDIRQKLSLSKGFGVSEVYIPAESEYVGKTIVASGLKEKDVNVLTLHREGKVIPNPRGERELLAGDKLVCFGRLDSLRDLIPDKTQKRRRPKLKKLKKAPAPSVD